MTYESCIQMKKARICPQNEQNEERLFLVSVIFQRGFWCFLIPLYNNNGSKVYIDKAFWAVANGLAVLSGNGRWMIGGWEQSYSGHYIVEKELQSGTNQYASKQSPYTFSSLQEQRSACPITSWKWSLHPSRRPVMEAVKPCSGKMAECFHWPL